MKAIMYHYVRREDPTYPYFRYLHINNFQEQLDYFQKTSYFLSREEFLKMVTTGEVSDNGTILTFDDGFIDHIQFVLPELKRRGLWGIFYIPTLILKGDELLDVHRVHALLGRFGGDVILSNLQLILSDEMLSAEHREVFRAFTYRSQVNDDKTTLVKRILNYYVDYSHRKTVLDTLMKIFYPDEKQLVHQWYLSIDNIRELHDQGMLVGSHSVSHKVLSKLPVEEQRMEIVSSLEDLRGIIGGSPVKTFCYPYGGFHTFSDETEKILTECGCLFSFNVEPRDISADDLIKRPQALPRYDCNTFPHGQARMG